MYTGRFSTKRQEPVKEIESYNILDLNILFIRYTKRQAPVKEIKNFNISDLNILFIRKFNIWILVQQKWSYESNEHPEPKIKYRVLY